MQPYRQLSAQQPIANLISGARASYFRPEDRKSQPGRHGAARGAGKSTRKFTQIDSYVHERLALFDSKKRNQRGRRWAEVHTYAWFKGLGVHMLAGSIRWPQAATAAT